MHAEPVAQRLAEAVRKAGGRAILVGGAVRDRLLGVSPKDLDVEVYGVPEDRIEAILAGLADHALRVGRSFPVWKAWDDGMGQDEAIDIALPRRDRRTGPKHTDFVTIFDPSMDFADASARRDFTMNAAGIDLSSGEFLDPHHGLEDMADHRLRHVSDHFVEDPLRVLRGMQFCARFDLTAAPETIEMCRALTPEDLSAERLWGEWNKLILKGKRPSAGLEFLRQSGWTKFFPELHALIGVPQNPAWHPEGDAWIHTLHCVDAFAETRSGDDRGDLVVGLAVLCHDFGKPATNRLVDGVWKAHGHEAAGGAPTRTFLGRMTNESQMIREVEALVIRHMIPLNLHKQARNGQSMDRAIRRLSTEVRLDRLARVCFCDCAGRPPIPKESPAADWLLAESARMGVTSKRPDPLILGRDLIAAGEKPGPHWGSVLEEVYARQLDGLITDKASALRAAIEMVSRRNAIRELERTFAPQETDCPSVPTG